MKNEFKKAALELFFVIIFVTVLSGIARYIGFEGTVITALSIIIAKQITN